MTVPAGEGGLWWLERRNRGDDGATRRLVSGTGEAERLLRVGDEGTAFVVVVVSLKRAGLGLRNRGEVLTSFRAAVLKRTGDGVRLRRVGEPGTLRTTSLREWCSPRDARRMCSCVGEVLTVRKLGYSDDLDRLCIA